MFQYAEICYILSAKSIIISMILHQYVRFVVILFLAACHETGEYQISITASCFNGWCYIVTLVLHKFLGIPDPKTLDLEFKHNILSY